jgi:hypothetical protein
LLLLFFFGYFFYIYFNKLLNRVLKILNSVCKKVSEPHFMIHPLVFNNSTSSDIRVSISSSYYDAISKLSFYIVINKSQVTVLNRSSNISISFSDSIDDMKSYFLDQCCFHQINLIITMSEIFGWTLLGNSFRGDSLNVKTMSGFALIYNDNYLK